MVLEILFRYEKYYFVVTYAPKDVVSRDKDYFLMAQETIYRTENNKVVVMGDHNGLENII